MLKDDEPAATYVHTQLRRWRVMTERDVQTDPIMTSLFSKAILEGLPAEAKRRLEEVVGLNTMTHKEFVDHVVHTVEKQRETEGSWKNNQKTFRESCYSYSWKSSRLKKRKRERPRWWRL